MFTGIVDHTGTITAVEKDRDSLIVGINCQFEDLQEGESIAIDGICLTVVQPKNKIFGCNISPETYHLTTAQYLERGREVNLERAMRLSDRLGGHWVSGHVDCRATIHEIEALQEFTRMTVVGLAPNARRYIMKKGSIAVNGVSLTINEVLADGFEVMLIPHTLERTNLKNLVPGSPINIEYDGMTRVIIHQFELIKNEIKNEL